MIRLFALGAYAFFVGVFTYFIGFVTGIAVPRAIDDGVATSAPLAVAIDVGLVVFFGAVHSAMARASFKRAWTRGPDARTCTAAARSRGPNPDSSPIRRAFPAIHCGGAPGSVTLRAGGAG